MQNKLITAKQNILILIIIIATILRQLQEEFGIKGFDVISKPLSTPVRKRTSLSSRTAWRACTYSI